MAKLSSYGDGSFEHPRSIRDIQAAYEWADNEIYQLRKRNEELEKEKAEIAQVSPPKT